MRDLYCLYITCGVLSFLQKEKTVLSAKDRSLRLCQHSTVNEWSFLNCTSNCNIENVRVLRKTVKFPCLIVVHAMPSLASIYDVQHRQSPGQSHHQLSLVPYVSNKGTRFGFFAASCCRNFFNRMYVGPYALVSFI